MSNAVEKLATKLNSRELAEKLVEAGLRDPTSIRQASDRKVATAVGRANLAAVRAVFPKE
jgi:hypothetical protein